MNWILKVSDPGVCLLDHCYGQQHHLALFFTGRMLNEIGDHLSKCRPLPQPPDRAVGLGTAQLCVLERWQGYCRRSCWDGDDCEMVGALGWWVEAGLWSCLAVGTSSRSRMPSFIIHYGQGSPATTRVPCPRKAVCHWVMETPAWDSAHHSFCMIFCSDRLRMVSCSRGRYEQTSQSLLLLGDGAQAPGYAHFS